MSIIKLKIHDKQSHTLVSSEAGSHIELLYTAAYQEGDRIRLESSEPGVFCEIRLDDSMLPAIVYIARKEINFEIPFGEKRSSYSPKSFSGSRHLISARLLDVETIHGRRNLALNPYDRHGDTGLFPHASANVETRGESKFAARNVIDGIFANASHGEYPFQSWGINQRADAELRLEFGCAVEIDEVRLTLRADFPHDNYWTQATVLFSDGSTEVLSLVKTHLPQAFKLAKRKVEWLALKELVKSDEASPFPALTQLEVWGFVADR